MTLERDPLSQNLPHPPVPISNSATGRCRQSSIGNAPSFGVSLFPDLRVTAGGLTPDLLAFRWRLEKAATELNPLGRRRSVRDVAGRGGRRDVRFAQV